MSGAAGPDLRLKFISGSLREPDTTQHKKMISLKTRYQEKNSGGTVQKFIELIEFKWCEVIIHLAL